MASIRIDLDRKREFLDLHHRWWIELPFESGLRLEFLPPQGPPAWVAGRAKATFHLVDPQFLRFLGERGFPFEAL